VLFGLGVATLPLTAYWAPEIVAASLLGHYLVGHVLVLPSTFIGIESLLSISSAIVRTEYAHPCWSLGSKERQFEIYGGDKDLYKSEENATPLRFEPFMIAEIFNENEGKNGNNDVRKFYKKKRPITEAMQHLLKEYFNQHKMFPELKCHGCYTKEWAKAIIKWKRKEKIVPPSPTIDKYILRQFFQTTKLKQAERSPLVTAIKILLKVKYPKFGKRISKTGYWLDSENFGVNTKAAFNEFISVVPELMFNREKHNWKEIIGDFKKDSIENDVVNDFVWAALFGDCDPWYEEI